MGEAPSHAIVVGAQRGRVTQVLRYVGLWLLAQAIGFAALSATISAMPDEWVGDQGAGYGWSVLLALMIAPLMLVVGIGAAWMAAARTPSVPGARFFAWSVAGLLVVHLSLLALFGLPS